MKCLSWAVNNLYDFVSLNLIQKVASVHSFYFYVISIYSFIGFNITYMFTKIARKSEPTKLLSKKYKR